MYIRKKILMYFYSYNIIFCCKNCKKIKYKTENNQNQNNSQINKKEEENVDDKDIEIIKNNDIYVKKLAFIKKDNKTYYKNKPVKVVIEER